MPDNAEFQLIVANQVKSHQTNFEVTTTRLPIIESNRPKFVDIFTAQGSSIAEEAINRIAKLYAVEKEARGKSPQERAAHRQADAKPIFDDLEKWLHAQLPKISGKSPLAQAIRYALGRMPKARPYLNNGFLELDNNTAERAVKPVAIGRKTGCSQARKVAVRPWPSYIP